MKTIPLTQGKVALVDDADYEKVCGFKWHAQKERNGFSAARTVREGGKKTTIRLHRFLTNCPPDMEVNHINGAGLDDRQENMEICTPQQQQFAFRHKREGASSKYRGVTWFKRDKCWKAQIQHMIKNIHLGYFDIEEDAARAYDAKSRELFGIHAAPNFSL